MRQQHLTFKPLRGLLSGALIAIALPISARAATLTDWQFDPANGQLELNLETGSVPTYYIETEPPRIIIDLPDTALETNDRDRRYPGTVRQILLSSPPSGGARIVLELAPGISLSPQQVQLQKIASGTGRDRWILYPSIVNPPASLPANSPAVAPPITPKIEFGQPWPASPNSP